MQSQSSCTCMMNEYFCSVLLGQEVDVPEDIYDSQLVEALVAPSVAPPAEDMTVMAAMTQSGKPKPANIKIKVYAVSNKGLAIPFKELL